MIEIYIVMQRAPSDARAKWFGGQNKLDWVPVHMTTDLGEAYDRKVWLENEHHTFTKIQSVLCDEHGELSAMGLPAPLPVA